MDWWGSPLSIGKLLDFISNFCCSFGNKNVRQYNLKLALYYISNIIRFNIINIITLESYLESYKNKPICTKIMSINCWTDWFQVKLRINKNQRASPKCGHTCSELVRCVVRKVSKLVRCVGHRYLDLELYSILFNIPYAPHIGLALKLCGPHNGLAQNIYAHTLE